MTRHSLVLAIPGQQGTMAQLWQEVGREQVSVPVPSRARGPSDLRMWEFAPFAPLGWGNGGVTCPPLSLLRRPEESSHRTLAPLLRVSLFRNTGFLPPPQILPGDQNTKVTNWHRRASAAAESPSASLNVASRAASSRLLSAALLSCGRFKAGCAHACSLFWLPPF